MSYWQLKGKTHGHVGTVKRKHASGVRGVIGILMSGFDGI